MSVTDDKIFDMQSRMIRKYKLPPQVGMFMALLVCMPHVTPTTVLNKIGDVDRRNLASRLRAKLKADEDVIIHTSHGYGYYLDAETRERLMR